MRKSIVECGQIKRFGLCPKPPDSEAWRRCGFAIGQHEIPLMVDMGKIQAWLFSRAVFRGDFTPDPEE